MAKRKPHRQTIRNHEDPAAAAQSAGQKTASSAVPDPARQRGPSGESGVRNKPRKMTEEELQELLQQIRRERGLPNRPSPKAGQRPRRAAGQEIKPQPRRAAAKQGKPTRALSAPKERAQEEPRRMQPPEKRRRQKQNSSSESGFNQGKKVFSKGFKRKFFIAWAVFAAGLMAGLVLLWTSLSRYEAGLPEHYIQGILQEISQGSLDLLHLKTADDISIDDGSLFADKTLVQKFLKEKHEGSPLGFVAVNAESSEKEKVYIIRSGDEKLLKVYLERNTESDREKNGWHETKTQMIAKELAVSSITAQIPTSGKLLIGGREVPASFITEQGSQIRLLENLMAQGLIGAQPTVDTYTVRGIFPGAAVSMTDGAGNIVSCTMTEDVYTAGFNADEAFAAEQRERVLSMMEPYAKYFSGDVGRGALSSFMLDDSPAYVNATSADVSWMQEHDGIALSGQSAENFKQYSEECFSCDIKFAEDILRNGESVRTWDTNMTWIFVKDGEYYLADFVTNR